MAGIDIRKHRIRHGENHVWQVSLVFQIAFQILWITEKMIDYVQLWRAGIAQSYSARLRAGWSGVQIPEQLGISFFTTTARPALRPTQPPLQWVPGALSPEGRRPGRETDHSPPSSAEVKNEWSYTSTPRIRLHGVVLSYEKHRDNFMFYLLHSVLKSIYSKATETHDSRVCIV
jgi:hypothetical protein